MSNTTRYTAENITNDDRQAYADLHKGIYGVKGSVNDEASIIAWFFNNYDELFRESEEQEARALAHHSEQEGIEFKSWSEYYDHLDNKSHQEWLKWDAERKAKDAENREWMRRFSPYPIIVLWEEGKIN